MIDPLESSARSPLSEMETLIAQNQSWLGALEQAASMSERDSNAIGRYGVNGGFLVLRENGADVYAKTSELFVAPDGRVLDGQGRGVLGFSPDDGVGTKPKPLAVPAQDVTARRFGRYEIDEQGVFFGVRPQSLPSAIPDRIALGRLCVAIFPAPEKLAQHTSDTLVRTNQSGQASLFPADTANLSGVQRQPSSDLLQRLRENARKVWIGSERAELDVALAGSEDMLVRVALDVVK